VDRPTGGGAVALRERIEALLDECGALERLDPSPFHDVRGMIEVAFSDDPASVRAAIEDIRIGFDLCPIDQKEWAEP
jgi:hypothetical protein